MITVRLAVLFFTLTLNLGALFAQSAPDATVHVDTTPSHQINSFDPDSALGSSLERPRWGHAPIFKKDSPKKLQRKPEALGKINRRAERRTWK